MGLYIDMEMPQNCQSCNFYNGLGCKATGRMFAIFYNVATRRSDCPLIEVPEPHGRLGDLDALMGRIEHDTPLSSTFEKIVRRYIENTPTVITASEEAK